MRLSLRSLVVPPAALVVAATLSAAALHGTPAAVSAARTPGLTPPSAAATTDAPVAPPVVSSPAAATLPQARRVTPTRPATRRPAVHQQAAAPATRPAAPAVRPAAPAPKPAPAPVRTTAPAPAPAATGSDDYPYRTDTTNANDPWGFTMRQCVSFVAWRLAQSGHPLNNATQNWGSALTWDDTARRLGYAVTTTASVGTVAQWNADESSAYYSPGSTTPNGTFTAGGYGHVGWVEAVYSDGSALVEQYNMGGSRAYSVMRVKAPRYLHLR